MNKKLRFFWTTFVALILIFNNLFGFFALNIGNLPDNVQAANLKVNIPLSFTPTYSIIHPNKPILYFTDKSGKKAHSINYETGETKSIQFDLPVEGITFANDEVYVTLLKSGHQQYLPSSDYGTGAVAIIDANNFTLKDRFDVNIDPFAIAVDMEGYIYLFGGSNSYTIAKSYSRETKLEVDTIGGVEVESYIQLNPNKNKIYTVSPIYMPTDINAYKINNGKFEADYDSPYHGNYKMSSKLRISPDGKYIFNSAGTIFKASDNEPDDMNYVSSLNATFSDAAFNIEENKIYTAIEGNKIAEYDYTNFDILKYYSTLGKVDSLFFQNDSLIAVSKDINNKYFIENISLAYSLPLDESDNLFNKNKYDITTGKYDSSRNKVYALNKTLNNLFVMDAETNKLENTIKLSYKPSDLAISEDFSKLYIVNEDENCLVSIYDLNDFSNIKDLPYKTSKSSVLEGTHRHIYEKNNKLYVIDGEWFPKLLIFDSNNFNEIKYSPIMEEVGDIAFSSDDKYIYKWKQSGFVYSQLIKYSLDGNKLTQVEISKAGYPMDEKLMLNREPLDTPNIILEDKGLLICKDKAFTLNYLAEPIKSFDEPIYAVDEKRNLAVGSTKIYNLDTMEVVRSMPGHSTNSMFFDKDGKLHLFNGKDMYSIDPLAPVGKIQSVKSMPENKEKDTPIDFPIVIQYPEKISLANENNISISDGKKHYSVKAFVSENMLIISHEDLPYSSNISLIVGEDAISDLQGMKFNNKLTLTFYTGKEYTRIAGLNRYETSVKVSQQWTSSKYAVLASGQDFADALSASPLAKKYSAPILLTNPKELDSKTEAEIQRLGVSEIFVIGGSASVSKQIEDKIASKGIKITRLQGKDRYKTSMAIANFIGTDGEIFIAAGSNFPDALSIASYAAAKGIPIVLTKKDTLPEGLDDYVSDYNINKTYVIGGSGVISDNLLHKMPSSERIYGSNRYETNLNVLRRFEFYFGTTFLASGQGFADALSASALAGLSQSPIVLADKSLPYTNEAFMGLKSIKEHMKMKYTIGGEGSVPSYVIDKLFK
ncbi:cell wall-binding repeat-containing protein [Clostridium sp. BSD9I1]|uniref:cell wall-binding repeat-containing protein n=1 Tax=Clostridium sp. BSD9I1 TaxID=2003589 RepID=UPI001648F5CB|nr:cell wall-binding repeat-containing protein [Clostridium sp. BSD9I1]